MSTIRPAPLGWATATMPAAASTPITVPIVRAMPLLRVAVKSGFSTIRQVSGSQ
jgi:hypothetical protein